MKKLFLFLIIFSSVILAQEKTNSSNQQTMPSISVTIGGKFIVNGTFSAFFSERVDHFITRIYNAAKENSLKVAQDLQTAEIINRNIDEGYAIRGIILKSVNGEEKLLDLAKFRVKGDFSNNPYLKNDDVIIFPAVDLEKNFIKVMGAVNNPITFMYTEGDKLSDAIELAQGINKSYSNLDGVIIYRLNEDASQLDSIYTSLNNNIELKRGDRVFVLGNESKRQDYKVNIIGEVINPGFYPITNNNTKIKDVIKMAGGFTSKADLSRSELIRGANAFEFLWFSEQLERLQMARMSTLIESDSLYFLIDEKLRFTRGNGLVDFARIFDENSPDGDFIIQNNDVIYIPQKINLIYVYGQVNKPGYLQYQENQKFNYYINLAGGKGETASDIYIIKGKSRSWISVEDYPDTKIEPGDYIWVSKNTPRTFWFHVEQAARIAAIVGSIATVILLFLQF
jgi:protein involved in polysaccharide export with SLBB domain